MEQEQDKINNLISLIHTQKQEAWTCSFHKILDAFEDFLVQRPSPPQSWLDRFAAHDKKFDYYQIVLPDDFQDPYEDDLGNIRRLRDEFADGKTTMALEHLLISRNYFIFENGHAEPIAAPRPILMLESADDFDPDEEEMDDICADLHDKIVHPKKTSKVDWDCCITLFQDGSYYAYNLDNDEEEELGEDILLVLDKWIPVLTEMRIVIPVEGRDYGILRNL
jgi:hypothetical protein